MPDDVVPEEKVVSTTPAFDAEAWSKKVAADTAAQVAQAIANQPASPARQPVAEEPRDALADVLEPYVTRATGRSNLIAQMAADKADFYTVSDADELALRLEYKEEVEKRALNLANAGRALPREDIFKHLKGEKEDEFFEKKQKRKAAREKRALEEGADHGGDGVPRARGGGMPTYVDSSHAYELQASKKLDDFLDAKEF